MFSAAGRRTPTYTKPMYGKKELNRLDIKNRTPTPPEIEDAILARLDAAWPQVDALLVLDQVSEEDCGVITRRVRERLAELGESQPEKFVLADSRERIGLFRNVCVKPNERELAGGRIEPGRAAFFTRGERGIDLQLSDGRPAKHIPAYPVSGPIDICGAGGQLLRRHRFGHGVRGDAGAGRRVRQPGGVDHHPPDRCDRHRDSGPDPCRYRLNDRHIRFLAIGTILTNVFRRRIFACRSAPASDMLPIRPAPACESRR